LQAELEATNREVLALTLELEDRVEARTAELRTAQRDLQTSNSELVQLTLDLEERVAQRTAELQKARDELELRVRERTRDLEAANQELESFSYSVSHDLRAPLRAVTGFASMLSREYSAQLPAPAQRYLQVIDQNAVRMGCLIDDLLALARFNRQSMRKQSLQVSQLVNPIVEELRREQGDRHIEVRLGPLLDCQADPSLLRQVFVNLLSNAFKFTRSRDPAIIEIGSREEGPERIYFIRDNGIGFNMQYADKLFGVFQRFHGDEEFEGTGVGLSIVARIVQRHGGRVWAEGKPDEGATFYFTLPSDRERVA
jgi:light-regulated signal transduction histidine kinase (bacteriophytochrome)